MFSFDFETYDTIVVARFRGDMTLETALPLREELELAAKRMKVRDMALDLTALEKVDTTGLGVLVGVSTKARSWGKRLMLYRAPQNVLDLLERVESSGFFPLLDDENDLKARQLYKRA